MKKGFVLFDALASLFCILLLSIPLLTTLQLMAKNTSDYQEDKNLLRIMEEVEETLIQAEKPEDISPSLEYSPYTVTTHSIDVNENIKKYTVEITKEGISKSKFFFYKIFDS